MASAIVMISWGGKLTIGNEPSDEGTKRRRTIDSGYDTMPKNNARGGHLTAPVAASLVLWFLAACAAVAPAAHPTASPTSAPTQVAATLPAPTREATVTPPPTKPAGLASCDLPTVVAPPTPAATVPFGAVDPATGLHVTGRPQTIDLASYRLVVSGLVDHPLQLTYDQLRCLPKVEAHPTLVCVGAFEDVATWAGPRLEAVLELAGVQAGAKDIELISADEYTVAVPLDAASDPKNLLAYELNGETLPVLHGFPLRAVFPDLTGNKWLKWLVEIKVY